MRLQHAVESGAAQLLQPTVEWQAEPTTREAEEPHQKETDEEERKCDQTWTGFGMIGREIYGERGVSSSPHAVHLCLGCEAPSSATPCSVRGVPCVIANFLSIWAAIYLQSTWATEDR